MQRTLKHYRSLALFIFIAWSPFVLSANHKVLTLGCVAKPEYHDYQHVIPLLRKAMTKLGYQLNIKTLSSDELIRQLRNGSLDGDCGRVYDYREVTGLELIKINPSVRQAYISGWALADNRPLKKTPKDMLQVASDERALALKTWVKKLGYKQVIYTPNTKKGLELLKQKKVDIFYGYESAIRSEYGATLDNEFVYLGPSIAIPVHTFLQPRHANLAKKLEPYLVKESKGNIFKSPFSKAGPINNKKKQIRLICAAIDGSKEKQALDSYFHDIFSTLNYGLTLDYQPPARAISNLKKDLLYDGSCARHKDFATLNKLNLIRIESPVAKIAIEVWTGDPLLQISHLNQLRNMNIAYVRGLTGIKEMQKEDSPFKLIPVKNTKTGLKMLAANRVDAYIGLHYFISNTLSELSSQRPLFASGTVLNVPIYMFLQQRNQYLEKSLTKLIKEKGPAFSSY